MSSDVFVLITENFWRIFWRTFWWHYLMPYKTPAKVFFIKEVEAYMPRWALKKTRSKWTDSKKILILFNWNNALPTKVGLFSINHLHLCTEISQLQVFFRKTSFIYVNYALFYMDVSAKYLLAWIEICRAINPYVELFKDKLQEWMEHCLTAVLKIWNQ